MNDKSKITIMLPDALLDEVHSIKKGKNISEFVENALITYIDELKRCIRINHIIKYL